MKHNTKDPEWITFQEATHRIGLTEREIYLSLVEKGLITIDDFVNRNTVDGIFERLMPDPTGPGNDGWDLVYTTEECLVTHFGYEEPPPFTLDS
jgi:hypothetical protein